MKKLPAALCTIAALFCFALTVSAAEADDITASCRWEADQNAGLLPNILDNRYNTLWVSRGESTVTLTAPEPVGGVYIIWDRPPASVTVTAENGNTPVTAAKGGGNGFLHEYLPLSVPSDAVTIHMEEEENRIERIYVFGEGEVPDWVQQWQTPYEKADLLVCSTHADDEHLWFGGTMPYYGGELGKKVQVVYLMHHVTQRSHELLDGLWTVGITAYPVIAPFEDQWADDLAHADSIYGREQVQEFQTEMIRRFKPDVVVGHDLDGEYGHGAHILNAVTLREAVENSGDSTYCPASAERYGTWTVQKCYLHLFDKGGPSEIIMDWEQPLSRFGGKTGFEMAQAGFACHGSQQGYFEVAYTGHPYDCHRFGLVFTTVGADEEKNDFFEHVIPTDLPAEEPEDPSPDPTPEEPQGPEEPDGTPTEFPTVWIAAAVAAGFLVAAAVWIAVRRRRKNG